VEGPFVGITEGMKEGFFKTLRDGSLDGDTDESSAREPLGSCIGNIDSKRLLLFVGAFEITVDGLSLTASDDILEVCRIPVETKEGVADSTTEG